MRPHHKKWFETDSFMEITTASMLSDRKAEDPARRLDGHDVLRLITRSLSRNARLVIILYYYEGQTMKEIGSKSG